MSRWIVVAALYGASGVLLGAFGAHGLRERVAAEKLASWQTAVHYQLFHSVALLGLALYASAPGARSIAIPGWLFALGMLGFSGSIYLLVLVGWRWLGPVTPLGGLLLIAGWLSLLAHARSS